MNKKSIYTFLMIAFFIFSNLIWTIVGVFVAILHVPYLVTYNRQYSAIVFRVKYTIIMDNVPGYKHWRGIALGNIVILNLREEQGDELHECIHVQQFMRYPFIFPFLNFLQTTQNGYRGNIFEKEAYNRANNNYYPSK